MAGRRFPIQRRSFQILHEGAVVSDGHDGLARDGYAHSGGRDGACAGQFGVSLAISPNEIPREGLPHEGGATLIRSGVPILRTVEIVSTASNKVQIEDACQEIAKHVSQGGQVSEILASNEFFPPMMKHMVKAGEATGNVDGMMNKIADFYDVECDATVSALTSLIEPLLIVILGIIVGSIVMAMFLPIFQLGAVAGGMG